jgi:ligand-binding sensor domain-containing protein/signal transduction histidine kinase
MCLNGQASDYSLRVWRTQDGLPQNRIQAISQTSDGYLWIGTPAGLARFDGIRFAIFDSSNTPAFHDDSILSLYVGRDDTLWIGTEGGGLVEYRGGAFKSYGAKEGLSNGFVRTLLEDKQGNLWIGTDRGFFARPAAGTAIQRLDGSGGLPVISIIGIQQDKQGRVWAASNHGPMLASGFQLKRFGQADIPNGLGRGLFAAADGTLWFTNRDDFWRMSDGVPARKVTTAKSPAMAVQQSHDGTIWVGTLGNGLFQLADGGTALRPAPVPALPDLSVLSIFEDRDRSIWVGTRDGLVRVTRTSIRTVAARDGLSSDNVSTVFEDRDGSIWIGTITSPMSRLGESAVKAVPTPSGFRARLAYRDRKGELWLGSSVVGLARIGQTGSATTYSTREGLRNNSVRQILEDRQGQLWIALGSGLSRWDGSRFHNYYIEDGLAYGSVRALLELRNGELLVGTDAGVNRIRGTQFVADKTLDGFKGVKVWSMLEDPGNGVWFGARGNGLYRLKDGVLRHLTAREGLPGNNVYQLIDDRQGNLWMSGSFGVASIPWDQVNRVADGQAEGFTVSTYGVAEGLESTEMNGGIQPAGIRTASGDIWFASVKGAVRIKPGLPRAERHSRILIEELRADDEVMPLTGEISVPAGRRKIEIAFTACDLLAANQAHFRYKLENFDSGWTHESQSRTAVYTNLPPGSYRFRVAALHANVPEASLTIRMHPHFFQTGWFLALCALGAAVSGWATFRFYARQTRARFAVLLAERTRLAREMHDTVIQGCVGVSALLEAAATSQSANNKVPDLVDMARKQIRLTLDEARQAVWDLRHSDLDSDLATSLRDFAGRFSMESAVPIGLEVSGTQPQMDGRAERNLLLVAREAIRNALSHGSPARIDLRLKFAPEDVCLEVSDDGIGFDPAPAQQSGHYGIMGMRERVEQLGGSLEIRSEPGRGTCLLARMPIQARATQ